MSVDSTYAPGMVVAGRYELESLVGQGSIGQVWVARSRALGSRVAVKLFSRAGEPNGDERFAHEARAAAQIEHPAIVRVFDFGITDSGGPFLVMELLRGESLEDMVTRGPVPATLAVRICLPLIDAFHAMHAQGIVHRDIKPANLFLSQHDPNGAFRQPKVIDFGLVKRWDQREAKLTPNGMMVGSPAYMAPEQAEGRDADARTDIWSMCIVLYELLTGGLPFLAESQYMLLKAVVERAPAPMTGVNPELVAIVMRGLAKNPGERWQSMIELGTALARWLMAQGVAEDAAGASVRASWLEHARADSNAPRAWALEAANASGQQTVVLPRRSVRRRRALFGAAGLAVVLAITSALASSARNKTAATAKTIAASEPVASAAAEEAAAEIPPQPTATATAAATAATPVPRPKPAHVERRSPRPPIKPVVRDRELGF